MITNNDMLKMSLKEIINYTAAVLDVLEQKGEVHFTYVLERMKVVSANANDLIDLANEVKAVKTYD